jgi:hypothetical protein
MSPDDVNYYRERAIQSREAALKADSQDVAAIHEELARLYDALLAQPELRPKLSIRSGPRAASAVAQRSQ